MTEDCTSVTLQVERSAILSPFETHCLTPTAMGLMSQIYTTQGIVQPLGYTKAYPIKYATSSPIIDPVPNQASGIRHVGWSQGPGSIFGYYNQLSDIMQLKVSAGAMYYEIAATAAPNYTFKHANGDFAPFNSLTKSFANDGKYMVIDTISGGFARIDLTDLTVQPFAPTLIKGSGGGLNSAVTAIDSTGRYAVIAYNADSGWGSKYFKLVDVASCTNSSYSYNAIPVSEPAFGCNSRDLLITLRQQVPTVQEVFNVRFVNNRTMTFDIRYIDQAGSNKYTAYRMTAAGQSKSLKQYLALGDSYISGEGAYGYRDGTDTARNECHQSLISYPYLLGANFTSFASVACSGAQMQHIESGEGRHDQLIGLAPSEYEIADAILRRLPGAAPQSEFVAKDNPEAITISIGGNDIGFGQILEKCVHPLKNIGDNVVSAHTCYDTYEDRAEIVNTINSKFLSLRSLYESLRDTGVDSRRVYIIGYPQVAKVGGECGLNVQMNSEEIAFAYELIAYLNSVIKRAADEAGAFYVDTQHAFDGHRLCEAPAGRAAMNGFTISRSASGGYDFKASFHPNQRGHQMLAATIAAQTNNLTAVMPIPKPKTAQPILDPTLAILQTSTKINRVLRHVRIVEDIANKVVNPLSVLDFRIDAQKYLTKAGGVYNLVINSEPVNLGNFTADANGNVAINTAIPATVPPGFHTLHLYGNDIFGNPIDIQQVVFVTAQTNQTDDSDGDGIADQSDSCVLASQSGTDQDNDGIDDVCDPLIGLSPGSGNGDGTGGDGGGGENGSGTGTGGQQEAIIWRDNAVIPITIEATSGP